MFALGLRELFRNISAGAKFIFVNIQHLGSPSTDNHVMEVDNGPTDERVEAVFIMRDLTESPDGVKFPP